MVPVARVEVRERLKYGVHRDGPGPDEQGREKGNDECGQQPQTEGHGPEIPPGSACTTPRGRGIAYGCHAHEMHFVTPVRPRPVALDWVP
ncbi:hypothetical protein GCM10025778_12750 [Paeniglutamicibacter antarcticus]|uniref:Uncharacterized protein n=1 Tax=Paeniglutamicibacter antarcticus TaxID=494023 RepID=A0ABP9TJL1_9MICC